MSWWWWFFFHEITTLLPTRSDGKEKGEEGNVGGAWLDLTSYQFRQVSGGGGTRGKRERREWKKERKEG